MNCKDCQHYYRGGFRSRSKYDGMCYHPDIPFDGVNSEDVCKFEQTNLRCNDCKYWCEAEGFEREDDCGGCTYGGGFMPMFLNSSCALKDRYRLEVEKEALNKSK